MPFLVGYVTPQDYGAVGDGTTDDTTAIQNALNAVSANGATLFFPAASYKITASLNATVNGTQIAGTGWGSQILYDGNVVSPAIKATGNIRLTIRDLRISQTNSSHFGTAIDFSQVNASAIEHVLIDGGGATGVAPKTGILMNASTCRHNIVRNCRINYGGTTSIGVSITGSSNSNTIQDVRLIPQADDVNSSGIYINGSNSTTIIHPDVESAAGFGIQLDTGAHSTHLYSIYSELNNVGLKIASGVIGTTLYGGTIQTSTTANLQDSGTGTQVFNAWPNSGSNTYNHVSYPNTDQFSINTLPVPAHQFQADDHGLIAWAYDSAMVTSGGNSVSGTLYLTKIVLRYAATLSKGYYSITSAAVGVTANQNYVGLYDSGGTLRASTAAGAIDALITSGGVLTATFSTPYAAAAGTYWLAFVNNATTPAQLGRASVFSSTPNANLAASAYRFAVNGTALTALPATITPASNTTTGMFTYWTGVN